MVRESAEPLEIEGLHVTTQQFPTFRAYRVFARLLNTLGPTFAGILPALVTNGMKAALELDATVLAMGLRQLDPDMLVSVSLDLLGGTSAEFDSNGKRVSVTLGSEKAINQACDDHGRLPTLIQILVHAISVNYAGFSKGASDDTGALASDTDPEETVGRS